MRFLNMYSWYVTLFCVFACEVKCGPSLMKRIRERQVVDLALNKGLDVQSQSLLQIPQPIQDILISINDKLRHLDTFSYTLKLARLDFSLEQLVKRMENIETKFGRLETKFDVRMEKIEEIVISKDIKEEFSSEYLSRRMESLNDKINNKAAYLDAKLDMKLEKIINKLELIERELQNSADDILERLVKYEERFAFFENEIHSKEDKIEELNRSVNNLQVFTKEDLTSTFKITSKDLSTRIDEFQEVMRTMHNDTIEKIKSSHSELVQVTAQEVQHKPLNSTLINPARNLRTSMCDDGVILRISNLTSSFEMTLKNNEDKLKKIDSDMQTYSRKIANGIQDLWQSSDRLKIDINNSLHQGNRTRDVIVQEFRMLQRQIDFLPRVEPKMKRIAEDLDKKISVISSTVDKNYATLLFSQNSFISSCHRIQDEETHVYQILQQIIYEMRNRSVEESRKIEYQLHQQNTKLDDTLTQMLSAVLETGNATNNMMRRIQRKANCMLRTNKINCKLIESLCGSSSLGLSKSRENELDLNPHDFAKLSESTQLDDEPSKFARDDLDDKNYDFLDYQLDNEGDYND